MSISEKNYLKREWNVIMVNNNTHTCVYSVSRRIWYFRYSLCWSTKPTAEFHTSAFQQIQDINSQVAQFRDLLINIGQPRDNPELREKIRKMRRNCVEACKHTSQLVLPHVRRWAPVKPGHVSWNIRGGFEKGWFQYFLISSNSIICVRKWIPTIHSKTHANIFKMYDISRRNCKNRILYAEKWLSNIS